MRVLEMCRRVDALLRSLRLARAIVLLFQIPELTIRDFLHVYVPVCHVASYWQGVALQNVALALGVVFLSIGVLSGFAIAWMVTSLVLCTTLSTVGLVRPSGGTSLDRVPKAYVGGFCSSQQLVASIGSFYGSSNQKLLKRPRVSPMGSA